MDPITVIGLVASVVQLIETTAIVVQYLNEVKNAPKERARLAQEVTNLLALLTTLRYKLEEANGTDPWFVGIRSLGVALGPLDQLKNAMEDLAKKLEARDGLKISKSLIWPINKKECDRILAKIEREKTSIGLALQGDTFKLAQAIKADTGRLPALENRLEERRLNENQTKIRSWLEAPDPSSNHIAACKKRQPTTGSWFIQGTEFARWKSDSASFLWLHGIPGCGKTVLCSSVIEGVIQHCRQDPGLVVAYFYFDFNNAGKQSYNNLIRSLVHQFSMGHQAAQEELIPLFTQCEYGNNQPAVGALLQVLKGMVQNFQHCYVIIDALDECAPRDDLLQFFEEVAQWKLSNLHLLVTSRKEKDIEDSIEALVTTQICLQSALVNADIRIYIQESLHNVRAFKKWPLHIQGEIESTLMKGARGMFRWVVCQMDLLQKCLNLKKLRQTLKSLPTTLDETYARILMDIEANGYANEAFTVLQWLCFSARPMQINEMVEVLAVDVEEGKFDPDNRLPEPKDILRVCSSLVSIASGRIEEDDEYDEEDDEDIGEAEDDEDIGEAEEDDEDIGEADEGYDQSHEDAREILRLAHFSVKEYLVADRIRRGPASSYSILEVPANISIVKCCLSYMLYFKDVDTLTQDSLKSYPLASYAANYWTDHARRAVTSSTDPEDIECLKVKSVDMLCTANCLLNWIRLNGSACSGERNFGYNFRDLAEPLYFASREGLTFTVERLLDNGVDINAYHEYDGSALQVASIKGHEAIVRLLLEKGADIQAHGGRCGNTIQAAAYSGKEKVVQLLLEKGADIHARESRYGNALQAAACSGKEKVIELLLQNGADINAPGGLFGNALRAAASFGHEKVVQLLLDNGANLDAQGGQQFIALQAATPVDYKKVRRLQWENSVELDTKRKDFRNTLQAAAYFGRGKVVQLMLDNGANVNTQGGIYGSALQAAACSGNEEVVQLLLKNGANVNAEGGKYGSALQAAASAGDEEVVQLLLKNGANINAKGGKYGSALQAAVCSHSKKVAHLLLQEGAIDARVGSSAIDSMEDRANLS